MLQRATTNYLSLSLLWFSFFSSQQYTIQDPEPPLYICCVSLGIQPVGCPPPCASSHCRSFALPSHAHKRLFAATRVLRHLNRVSRSEEKTAQLDSNEEVCYS